MVNLPHFRCIFDGFQTKTEQKKENDRTFRLDFEKNRRKAKKIQKPS